jgi:peptide/nickel transport system permease protein
VLAYVLIRLGGSVIVVAVVSLIVFSLTVISGGDPALIFAGDIASAADVEAIRLRMGLDQPFFKRFFGWAFTVLHGNLGTSLFTSTPVSSLIRQRLEPTATLTVATIVTSIVVAVPIGIMAALRPDSWLDQLVVASCSVAFAVPGFIVGYVLIYLFSLKLGLLPVQGYAPLSSGLGNTLRTLVLPTATLSLVYVALLARTTRAGMIDVLAQDFIRTARAKGAGTVRIMFRHALRNTANAILTVVGLGIASLLGGVVIVETVFGLPGLGRLTVDAVMNRDYPVIQALILLAASLKIVVNLVIDLLYAVVDRRIEV